ncbi:endo-1,4-beta-xylanase [Wenyingzhuangia marina]|uniref:Beta-xylanase n=1 Tax=Wenyingzhuangia marina TaxID=1195760 RepID=A0A1M5TV90_9FLAO|nr:endo-1,4-beta-xylanase [Wenyingzhuangia marina]GGF70890.1 hypothetical protein GCM10011397_12290 [Wenyingzhuangia marina]SHH54619.1 Glycosyl hydrolase family 10 [Wenyingzhuangia marina]
MKNIYKISLLASTIALLSSCQEVDSLDFQVEKSEAIAKMEEINSYQDLKSYINRETDPNFKLGAGIGMSDYISQNVMYRLLNRNFDEMSAGYGMKHGAIVQSDGSLDLDNVNEFIAKASAAEISVFGHTLCWHANQNATYLNRIIAPDTLSATGPGWELITKADFETDDNSNYSVNSNVDLSFTAVGEGANGTGRALKLTNAAVRANDWEAQLYIVFSPVVKLGERYTLTMDIRSDVDASYPTQAQISPGAYKHWDFFGALPSTTTWTTYTKEITISTSTENCGAIAFNLGKTATNFYFDNITLTKYSATGSVQTEEKTPEQKKEIVGEALDNWISEMVTNCAPYVKAWDVVNEPMSDWPNQFELKSGVGKTDMASDEFYWQDYLGKDYAVEAFRLTRQYGNPDDILFINDYGLEGGGDKCDGLIQYVEYIESKGQVVDGIGTQMHVTLGETTIENIRDMLTKLAATGKLVKISELDMGIKVGGSIIKTEYVTADQLQQMSDFYEQIVKAYFEIVPVDQRYGITQWAMTDSPEDSFWRRGEPIGLWDLDYSRKPAYTGFAKGLSGL